MASLIINLKKNVSLKCLNYYNLFSSDCEKEKNELLQQITKLNEKIEYEKQPNIAFEKEKEELILKVCMIIKLK